MASKQQELREIRKFGDEEIEVILQKLRPPEESEGRYPEFAPGMTIENGIRYERDVAVKLRDGTTIYTDIYRPDDATCLPAIVAWSPYGKRARYAAGMGGMPPGSILGVPTGAVSPMAKFEGPDPAFWWQKLKAAVKSHILFRVKHYCPVTSCVWVMKTSPGTRLKR